MNTSYVVLDTNILVAAGYNGASASRRIVHACLDGRLTHYLSPKLRSEYEYILKRALRVADYLPQLREFIDTATVMEPTVTSPKIPDDRSDEELVALALTVKATLLSNDHHLLTVNHSELTVCRPSEWILTQGFED